MTLFDQYQLFFDYIFRRYRLRTDIQGPTCLAGFWWSVGPNFDLSDQTAIESDGPGNKYDQSPNTQVGVVRANCQFLVMGWLVEETPPNFKMSFSVTILMLFSLGCSGITTIYPQNFRCSRLLFIYISKIYI